MKKLLILFVFCLLSQTALAWGVTKTDFDTCNLSSSNSKLGLVSFKIQKDKGMTLNIEKNMNVDKVTWLLKGEKIVLSKKDKNSLDFFVSENPLELFIIFSMMEGEKSLSFQIKNKKETISSKEKIDLQKLIMCVGSLNAGENI